VKVFFDVDGVLIHGWHADPAVRKPWDATIETDLGVNREAFQRLLFGTSADRSRAPPMHDCLVGRRDLHEVLTEILPRVGYQGRAQDFMRYWFEKDSCVNVQTLQLVQKIRKSGRAQVFVATGQEHHRARFLWNELGFSKCFAEIFYSAALGHPKDDIRFFEAINRVLRIETGEPPLFFDDRSEIVEVARSAGWDAQLFASAETVRQHPRLRHVWPG
jgi:putative hydrolase of the HAD superfamily